MRTEKSGFTLIELLIVMTVIAILIAIAIPQFNSYRIRGYNSASASDLRNARSSLESFYSDNSVYSSSSAGGSPGVGAALTAAANSTGAIAAGSISPPDHPARDIAAPGLAVSLSQNVVLVINTSTDGEIFAMGAKNNAGDRCFGMDPDPSATYWVNGTAGSALTGASLPLPVPHMKNFLEGPGAVGSGVCAGSPPGAGQTTWAIL